LVAEGPAENLPHGLAHIRVFYLTLSLPLNKISDPLNRRGIGTTAKLIQEVDERFPTKSQMRFTARSVRRYPVIGPIPVFLVKFFLVHDVLKSPSTNPMNISFCGG
jgi:hypothetical protein